MSNIAKIILRRTLFRSGLRSYSSHSPISPTAGPPRKKVTINTLRTLHASKTPIAMITAHDFPSGLAADQAGVDIVLVGDSLAMVALGMEDTNQLELDDIVHHCRAVSRGVRSAFTVGDLPMGAYEISPEHAVKSSIRIIQKGRVEKRFTPEMARNDFTETPPEAGLQRFWHFSKFPLFQNLKMTEKGFPETAVKLEGGLEMAQTISRITSVGIPVLGHIGLTPQRQHSLGGFRVQGKTSRSAEKLLDDALALQEAGCFAIVLEAVPQEVATIITNSIGIPTIGIGAGAGCSGQVLVQIDMLGNFPSGRFMPKFVKTYENIFEKSMKAIEAYKDEVKNGTYPAEEHTYAISAQELEDFQDIVEERKSEFEEYKSESGAHNRRV